MDSAPLLPSWHPGLKHHCVIKWNYALNHCPLSCSCSHSLPLFISLLPHQLSIFFSFLFEVIIGSWDSFMTFILLGSSPPSLSFLSSSLSLSVNYPCSLICRHPSNLRFPVMNQVPPPPPPLLPPPPPPPLLLVSAKQLTNLLSLIKRHKEIHAKRHIFALYRNHRLSHPVVGSHVLCSAGWMFSDQHTTTIRDAWPHLTSPDLTWHR